jgi:hypothetical protein
VVKRKLEGTALTWIENTPGSYVRLSRNYLHQGIGDPLMQEILETGVA